MRLRPPALPSLPLRRLATHFIAAAGSNPIRRITGAAWPIIDEPAYRRAIRPAQLDGGVAHPSSSSRRTRGQPSKMTATAQRTRALQSRRRSRRSEAKHQKQLRRSIQNPNIRKISEITGCPTKTPSRLHDMQEMAACRGRGKHMQTKAAFGSHGNLRKLSLQAAARKHITIFHEFCSRRFFCLQAGCPQFLLRIVRRLEGVSCTAA